MEKKKLHTSHFYDNNIVLEIVILHFPDFSAPHGTLRQKPTFYPEIPYKLTFEKSEFYQILDSRNVNFVKNETLKI